jgi:DNA-directed RNA polymerase III subunit RPC6
MAFQSSPSTTGSDDPTKIELLAESIYDAVRDSGDRPWTQKDLEDLDVIPENNILVLQKVIQKLCNEWLFRPLRDGSLGLCWRWRSEDDAKKYVPVPLSSSPDIYHRPKSHG